MNPVFQRTAQIIGEDGVELLSRKTAAVFGLGGVGSYAAEALVRAGVGHLIFIDKDSVDISNVNRQLVAVCKHAWPLEGGCDGGAGASGESRL